MRKTITCITFALFGILRTGNAQPTIPEIASPALNQSSLKLLGQGSPIGDVRLSGEAIYIPGAKQETGPVSLLSKADGTARIDVSVPSGKHGILRFPRSSLSPSVISGPDGQTQPVPWQDLLIAANWFFPEHLLNVLNASDHVSVVADPKLCSAGLVCVTNRLASPTESARNYTGRLSEMTISLDATTLLPARLDYAAYPTGRVVPKVSIQVRYSDYQTIEGHAIPTHLEEFVNGSLDLDIHLSSEELHASLSPAELNGENQ